MTVPRSGTAVVPTLDVVTFGEALLYTAGAVWRCPPFAVKVIDALGAGRTVSEQLVGAAVR